MIPRRERPPLFGRLPRLRGLRVALFFALASTLRGTQTLPGQERPDWFDLRRQPEIADSEVGDSATVRASGLRWRGDGLDPVFLAAAPGVQEGPSARTPVGVLIPAGALGAGVGYLAGGLAGGAASLGCEGDPEAEGLDCLGALLLSAILGAAAVGSLTTPAGVHLANGRRGSFPLGALGSLAAGGVGLLAAVATDSAGALFAVPVFQVSAAVMIERRTSPGPPP